MKRLFSAACVAALLAAAGCYTQPPPPPATDASVDSRLLENDRREIGSTNRMEERQKQHAIESALKYRTYYIRSIPGLGAVADMAVLADMTDHPIENTDDIERLLFSFNEFFLFVDPKPNLPNYRVNHVNHQVLPVKSIINKALAANGIRGLYIHCAEERLKRDQLLLNYLRGTDDRLGDHRDLVDNHEASLRMFQKTMDIEQIWLGALKSGLPLSAAKRNKAQSYAAFVKELAAVRKELPPPPLPDVEEGSKRAARAVKRAKRIAQKLAMPVDTSEWTPERTARHEAMRAAVQTWLSAAEKRLKVEDAYARALKSGGEPRPSQAPVWKARYAAYEALANACVEAVSPAWLPPPPAFIAQSGIEREEDWRLDPATAALEEAKASAAVWRGMFMFPSQYFTVKEPYKKKKFRDAFYDASSASLRRRSYAKVWRDAVQKWRLALADEYADDAEKRAAAEAAQTAYKDYRAAPMPDYWQLVDEKRRIRFFMENEASSMDVETAVYEIVVYKIAESMLIAMDIEHMYDEKIRLSREERAEGGFEQLVAVKEWQAALMDGGATEEEVQLAQDTAMLYGREHTWKPYWATRHAASPIMPDWVEHDSALILKYHPLKFRNDHPMTIPSTRSETEEFNQMLERLRQGK